MILFDARLAKARVWKVERFAEEEHKAIVSQGKRLNEMVKEVENALQVGCRLSPLLRN